MVHVPHALGYVTCALTSVTSSIKVAVLAPPNVLEKRPKRTARRAEIGVLNALPTGKGTSLKTTKAYHCSTSMQAERNIADSQMKGMNARCAAARTAPTCENGPCRSCKGMLHESGGLAGQYAFV